MNRSPLNVDSPSLIVPAADRAWVVIHTRPRCEKKVADYCRRMDVAVYLPLQEKTHRYGGRAKSFSSPLFPGYAFCVVDSVERGNLRQNRYVANVLDVIEQEKLVGQLRQIHQALSVGDVLEVMPYLQAGKTVRVQGGTFKGLEGIVLRVKGKTRVVINVDMIQQSVAVEVESSMLSPA